MEYENGKPIGERKEYYESGKIFMIIKTDSEGNSYLKKYFENGNLMEISSIINYEKKITKIGFENGNYVLYKENNQLEYYNSSDEFLKTIRNQKINNINLNNQKKFYLDYPNILINYEKEGLVMVEFTIEKNGKLSKLNILESFDPIASEAVTKLINRIVVENSKLETKEDFLLSIEFKID
ncbi:MAG: energy transducer TonB [Chitinophagales bacterium]